MEKGVQFFVKLSVSAALVASLFAMTNMTAFAATGTGSGIVEKSVNFRSEPSTSKGTVYGLIKSGTKFSVIEKVNSAWIKVKIDNKTGYLSTNYVNYSFQETPVLTDILSGEGIVDKGVNFRSQPSTNSTVYSLLSVGTKFKVIQEINENWLKVEVNGKVGYLSTNYVSYETAKEETPTNVTVGQGVVTKGVNFRSEPSTNGSIVSFLSSGTKFTFLSEVNAYWIKIELNGKQGYVSTSYVSYEKPEIPQKPQETIKSWEIKADAIISSAEKYLGTPYKFGAKAGSGTFDCSLLTQTVFGENGIKLDRNSRQQSLQGVEISKSELRKGDLVFFSTTPRENKTGIEKIGHVGIYIGDGKMIHTYGEGGVKHGNIDSGFWKEHYIKSMRVIK